MKTLLLVFFLFSAHSIIAQDFNEVDAIVKAYPTKFKSIESFADRISSDFKNDIEKTRAVYFWISNNISYDFQTFRNRKEVYKRISFKTEADYQKKQHKQEYKYAEQCLRRKKAVCEGYSLLLKFTLEKMHIQCEFISGFTKLSVREIGKTKNIADHAWNAVKINNNNWKLIDATWSTGNRESTPTEFDFDDTYFFINPDKFILDHFPENEKWQLLEESIQKSDFFLLPKIFKPFFKTNITLGKASLGLIKVEENDTITLKLKSVNEDKFYEYAFKNDVSNSFIFEKIGNEFVVKIPYKFKRPTSLILFFEDKSILEYKVILKR